MGTFDPFLTASQFLAEHSVGAEPCLRFWNGGWYRWTGSAYAGTSPDEIKKSIWTYLQKNGHTPVRGSTINAVVAMLRLTTLVHGSTVPCWLSESPVYPADQIVVARNGLLHLPGLLKGHSKLLPHTPALFSLNGLGYAYDKEATCPQWERFLSETWLDDVESIQTLQEWFGYCLLPDTRQQTLLMLDGPMRSGKSTIGRVIRMLLGPANVASPTMRSLSGSFGLWNLVGKLLAIVPDASAARTSDSFVELVKSLTGEDALDIERKNLAVISSVKLTARLMVIANQPPAMVDPSGALSRRILALETKRSWAGKEDVSLTDNLAGELPGILNWAIAGSRRLQKRGHFRQPKSARYIVDQYTGTPATNGKATMQVINAGRSGKSQAGGDISINLNIR